MVVVHTTGLVFTLHMDGSIDVVVTAVDGVAVVVVVCGCGSSSCFCTTVLMLPLVMDGSIAVMVAAIVVVALLMDSSIDVTVAAIDVVAVVVVVCSCGSCSCVLQQYLGYLCLWMGPLLLWLLL